MIGILIVLAIVAGWIAVERLTEAGLSTLIDGAASLFDRNDNTTDSAKSLLLSEIDDEDD